MSTADYHLAQANIARMKAPLDDPIMAGFVERLDPVNQLADESPGFVWRLQTEAGDATSIQAFDDPMIIVNMSVWETIEALDGFVYRSEHVVPLQKRAQWFERPQRSPLVLWWIGAGTLPTVENAKARLELLWQNGPTPEAFTFRHRFEHGRRMPAHETS